MPAMLPPEDHHAHVLACVEENQGAHLRELCRRSSTALGTAIYHLHRLESEGLISARRDGRYVRFFAGRTLGIAQKDLLVAMRRRVPCAIVTFLTRVGPSTQRELSTTLGVSRSTLCLQVNDLITRGVVARESRGRSWVYRLQDPDLTARTLAAFGPSFDVAGAT
jgi:predicted transcriptional regulator